MARERHKPAENVAKLRQVDVLTGARACVRGQTRQRTIEG